MNDEIKIEKDMTPKLIGETYMKYPTENSTRKYRYGLYECQYCNKEFEAQSNNIKHGLKSCGCQRKGINKTHGLKSNKFYMKWKSILSRCNNPQNASYINYGGRGITVCNEWLSLQNFIIWCEQTYIEGMTLDRINNDDGYYKENCRWATRSENGCNKRKLK